MAPSLRITPVEKAPPVIRVAREMPVLPEQTGGTGDHLSFSQIDTYSKCSWKYYLRYIKKLPDPYSLASAIGTAGHGALETNAKVKIRTKSDMALPDIQDLTSDNVDLGIQDIKESKLVKGQMKDEAISKVSLFRIRDAEAIVPVAAEYRFSIDIGGDEDYPATPPPVIGFIDAIEVKPRTLPTGAPPETELAVTDYKFVNQKRSQAEIDTTSQLVLYDIAVTEALQGKSPDVIGLRQFGTRKDGPWVEFGAPSPELLSPSVRSIRHERLKQKIRRIYDAIQKGVFFPTDDAKICGWCPYRQMCQFSLVQTSDKPNEILPTIEP